MAISAVVAIVLILIFIAKEAAPLFYSHEVRERGDAGQDVAPQLWPGYDESRSIWQPVSDVPKFGLWPLVARDDQGHARGDGVCGAAGRRRRGLRVAVRAAARTREIVKPVVELLAGIPSVVLGFFALMVMATWFQDTFGLDSRLNALVSGVALAFAIDPGDLHAGRGRAARRAAQLRRGVDCAGRRALADGIGSVVLPAASPGHRRRRRAGPRPRGR